MQLAVTDVGLSYGDRRVLTGVSLSLEERERVLLLGLSGSGESSLLNIICGLQTPDQETVSLGEEQMVTNGDSIRKRLMGIIFQTLRLVFALTVRANLLLAQQLQLGSTDAALVDTTPKRLGISHRAKARPFELSQGEAQRAHPAMTVLWLR